jgi:hypothetical protein
MAEQRIKGQEVTVSVQGPDGTEDGLDINASVEFVFDIETLSESYLGETSDRKDELYRGVTGNMEYHMARGSYFDFVQKVVDRARRRSPASEQFNITASLQFPSGERRRIQVQDVFFGQLPLNVGGRQEYVQGTVNWECSEFRFF